MNPHPALLVMLIHLLRALPPLVLFRVHQTGPVSLHATQRGAFIAGGGGRLSLLHFWSQQRQTLVRVRVPAAAAATASAAKSGSAAAADDGTSLCLFGHCSELGSLVCFAQMRVSFVCTRPRTSCWLWTGAGA